MGIDILPTQLSWSHAYTNPKMLLRDRGAKYHIGMTGAYFQEEVWSMAGEAGGRSNEEAAQLAPSLSEVQLVEAFFDVEQRVGIAAAAAAHPAALPQVHMSTLLKSHDKP